MKKVKKLKWCSRDLFYAPLFFTLASSPEILELELKRLKLNALFGIPEGKDATTNFIKNENGHTTAIVCLFDHSKPLLNTLSLIVHEATHIWQEVANIIGEERPGIEFEAYSIQAISQQLFMEYIRQTGRKKIE